MVKSGSLKQGRGVFGTQPTMFILASVNEDEDVMGSVILLLTDPSDCYNPAIWMFMQDLAI